MILSLSILRENIVMRLVSMTDTLARKCSFGCGNTICDMRSHPLSHLPLTAQEDRSYDRSARQLAIPCPRYHSKMSSQYTWPTDAAGVEELSSGLLFLCWLTNSLMQNPSMRGLPRLSNAGFVAATRRIYSFRSGGATLEVSHFITYCLEDLESLVKDRDLARVVYTSVQTLVKLTGAVRPEDPPGA
jgi:hypothetical protein